MSGFIGPALPPHLKNAHPTPADEEAVSKDDGAQGPSLNSKLDEDGFKAKFHKSSSREEDDGSVLLLSADISDEEFCGDDDDDELYGPPPSFKPNQQMTTMDNKEMSDLEINSNGRSQSAVSHREAEVDLPETDKYLGPALPPGFKSAMVDDETRSSSSSDSEGSVDLPDTEKHLGPALPLGFKSTGSSDDSLQYCGPALPPGFKSSDATSSIDTISDNKSLVGPALPPGFKCNEEEAENTKYLGPPLPPEFEPDAQNNTVDSSESESEEVIGPVPAGNINTDARRRLELRALKLRHSMMTEGDSAGAEQKRESWMLELPPEQAVTLGLGPRQFRKRERLDLGDRSVWTDTPSDKLKKKPSQEPDRSSLEMEVIQARDDVMQQMADQHSVKRSSDSLLEMHQKKLKKKKKKDEEQGKKQERRPFSREDDLQTNRFDEAQKKSIFNKARLLNDRFSAGQSKFL